MEQVKVGDGRVNESMQLILDIFHGGEPFDRQVVDMRCLHLMNLDREKMIVLHDFQNCKRNEFVANSTWK